MSVIPFMELTNITKQYPGKCALSSVSLMVERGSCTVLQGRNGSGKSTLIQIIGGFITPTSGQRIVHYPRQPIISYVPDRFPKLKFTAMEYLTHMGSIHHMNNKLLRQRIIELHDQFLLSLDNKQYMLHYSKGMLQKVNMMQALLLKPDLILLDEPWSGLDHESCKVLTDVLVELKGQGVTIVLATHEMPMALSIADRLVTIAEGTLRETSSCSSTASIVEVLCTYEGPISIHSLLESYTSRIYDEENGLFRLEVNASDGDAVLLTLLTAGGSIQQFHSRKDNLYAADHALHSSIL